MPEIGHNLLHFSIVEKIGVGEVFLAKDHKLGRDVALEVLPEEYAKDIDRVARFQRKAKLLETLKIPIFGALAVFLLSLFSSAAQPPQKDPACSTVSMPYEEVQPIAMALKEAAPVELRRSEPDALAKAWPVWAARRSTVAQERMTRGDEDTLGNLIIFGTSFTAQPRLIQKDLAPMNPAAAKGSSSAGSDIGSFSRKVFDARLDDFIRALEAPGTNDRLVYLRRLLERKNPGFSSTAGRAELRQYLIANLLRMLKEQQGYEKAIEEARRSGNSSTMLATSETLYRARGLSVDTALFPNYAVEESLKAI